MRLYRQTFIAGAVLALFTNGGFTDDGLPGNDLYYDNTPLIFDGENELVNTTGYGELTAGVLTSAYAKVGEHALDLSGTKQARFYGNSFKFGTADFTVEGFLYPLTTNGVMFLDCRPNSTNGAYLTIGTDSSSRVAVTFGGVVHTTTAFLSANTWQHMAYCRRNGVGYLFMNGVQVYSVADTTTYISRPDVALGYASYGGSPGNMIVDQFRVTNGTARYVTAFTPQLTVFDKKSYSLSTVDPHWDAVSALVVGDVLADSEGVALVPGGTGVVSLSAIKAKFAGRSILLPNTTFQYCEYAKSAAFTFPSDFTIDIYVNPIAWSTTLGTLIDCRNGTNGSKFCMGISPTGMPYVYVNSAFSYGVDAVPLNAWTHLAVCRIGTNLFIFVNGKLSVTVANFTASLANSGNVRLFGSSMSAEQTQAYCFHGYAASLRVTRGVGRYPGAFTPVNRAYPKRGYAVSTKDVYWRQTALLAHLNNDAINAVDGNPLTANAITFTEPSSYFTGFAAQFNGSNSYVEGNALDIGTGDFTLEGMGYVDTTLTNRVLFSSGGVGVSNAGGTSWWLGSADTGDATRLAYGKPGLVTYSATGVLPLNAWFSWVMSRRNGVLTVLINGAPVITYTDAALNMSSPTGYVCCIGNQNKTTQAWNGLLSEVRLTLGVGRYSKGCKVPVGRFPEVDGFVDYATQYPDDPFKAQVIACVSFENGVPLDLCGDALRSYGAVVSTGRYIRNGAGYFNGTNAHIALPYRAGFDLAASDFTIEGFFNYSDVAAIRTILAGQSEFHLGIFVYQGLLCYFASSNHTSWNVLNGYDGILNSKGTLQIRPNQTYHFAFVRSGNDWYGFVNGKLDMHVISAASVFSIAEALNIGRWGNNTAFGPGMVDKFKITLAARYTADFDLSEVI